MNLLLEVKDNKADFILELLKNFPYVKTKPISRAKALLIEEIKEAIINVNLAKKGKLKAKPIKELLNEI
ncbi:MAG: hypothetical protein HYY40_06160 [Bacteroidetes bacterium]|nr:hypothetical protein [Bacteroidota bacterium]